MSHYEIARLRKRIEELEKENNTLIAFNRRLRVYLAKSKKGLLTQEYLDRIEASLRARSE